MDGNQVPDFLKPISPEQALKDYTINLTAQAKSGKVDPVVGRESEIRRVMEILSRRTKNNPILIGEAGVGKTAIVEGLAQKIAVGQVPTTLKEKDLLVLDFAALLAGAKFRGEFEERLKGVVKAVEEGEGKYVLFIDEIHTLVGGGASEGSVDAANILKPSLARGTLRTIGATTITEYRKYIEKDPALARRFQPVMVNEPTVEDTISVLRGIKERYELHHGIRITDNALIAAARLSAQYIPQRFLPDKAIDLIDEAAAAIKIETESMPTELDELRRKITTAEIAITALKKSNSAKATLDKEKNDLNENKKKAAVIEKQWNEQKDIIQKLQEKRAKIDALRIELEQAERNVELEKAAEIKFGKIPSYEKELLSLQADLDKIPQEERVLREEVDEEDIAKVVARWTGIPVTRMLSSEADRLSHLEEELGERVIGQKEALSVLSRAIRRNRSGLGEKNRPIGSFLFLGPTGVGKTETAKALATILFNDEHAITRIDMSEYQESHTVARLIGAPPGYIGYDEGGQLTEAVRRRPYSVVLLDEIEKAHPSVFNLFLQMFDEGRLTDSKGTTVDFRNTIIIMTSNLGSDVIQEMVEKKKEEREKKVWELLHTVFRPEFLNRLDNVVVYNPLSAKEIVEIAKLQLQQVVERMQENNITLVINDDLALFLAEEGYDPIFGARPLKRLIEEKLVDPIALAIVENKIKAGDIIKPKIENGKIIL